MKEADSQDKCDIFLVHGDCASDRRKAERIKTILERNNISCLTSEQDEIGKPRLEAILNMVKRSKRTLVFLSFEPHDSPWLKLDVIIALEKAVLNKKAFVCLLVEGHRRKEFKNLGLLGIFPYLSVDFNCSDWEKELLDEVQKGPEILDNPLPAGNLALGLVFSVVVGYYRIVLPNLRKVMKEHRTVKENLSTTSTRFFILIPSDCKMLYPLTQCNDSRIELLDKICVKTKVYYGTERTYDVMLYKISDGSTVYYFVGEIPYVLNTIFMLHANKTVAEVDLSSEVDRFLWTLKSVLSHSKHKDCEDTFHVINFNAAFLVDTVLNKIKEDVCGNHGPNAKCDMTSQAEHIKSQEGPTVEKDAAVVFDKEDQEIASNIITALEKRFKVAVETPGKSIYDFLRSARWKIIILSKETCLRPEWIVALSDSIVNDKIGVIPVLNGLMVKDIPEFMSCMSCISTTENYIDSLLHIMNGEEFQMNHCLPRGDVHTGLVWGYIHNYLPIPLLGKAIGSEIQPVGLDLTNRIKNTLREKNITYGCIKKLYVCIPKSCEDRRLDKVDGVTKVGELEAVNLGKRPYSLEMYRIVSEDLPSGQVCFLGEQPASTKTLFDISKRYRDVGISSQDLHNQSEEFYEGCTTNIGSKAFIQNVGDLNSLCHFLFYDDEMYDPEGSLSILKNVLKDAIIADLANNVEVVYP